MASGVGPCGSDRSVTTVSFVTWVISCLRIYKRDMKIIASNGRAESFRELTHVEHGKDGP